MGGYGSGISGCKPKSEQVRKIDIRYMNRNGMLEFGASTTWNWSYGDKILEGISIDCWGNTLTLHQDNDPKHIEQSILLTWTSCHYGGQRPWFLCPVCNRRAAILYMASASLSCSKCQNITYYSRCETKLDRLLRKKNKLRKRLTVDDGWGLDFFCKPKGMHQKTYDRLMHELAELEMQIDNQAEIRFGEFL